MALVWDRPWLLSLDLAGFVCEVVLMNVCVYE